MRLIDQLVKAVDMTAVEKTIEVNDKEFTFWVTPLTAAEREKALKEAGDGAAQSSRFAMSLIISKCREKTGQACFIPADAARLRRELPSAVFDQLLSAVMGTEDEEAAEESEDKSAGEEAE
jgi:hypothetical protein